MDTLPMPEAPASPMTSDAKIEKEAVGGETNPEKEDSTKTLVPSLNK